MAAERKREYRRWFSIGGRSWEDTLKKCERLKIEVVRGGKPGMVAWYALLLKGTPDQIRKLESWWGKRGQDWFNRRPQGAWDA